MKKGGFISTLVLTLLAVAGVFCLLMAADKAWFDGKYLVPVIEKIPDLR